LAPDRLLSDPARSYLFVSVICEGPGVEVASLPCLDRRYLVIVEKHALRSVEILVLTALE
jgi:hypothetical protein